MNIEQINREFQDAQTHEPTIEELIQYHEAMALQYRIMLDKARSKSGKDLKPSMAHDHSRIINQRTIPVSGIIVDLMDQFPFLNKMRTASNKNKATEGQYKLMSELIEELGTSNVKEVMDKIRCSHPSFSEAKEINTFLISKKRSQKKAA